MMTSSLTPAVSNAHQSYVAFLNLQTGKIISYLPKLFRIYEIVFRFYEIIFRLNEILFREKEISFR